MIHLRNQLLNRGMTLAELIAGMAVMGIIMAAAATFATAVATGWSASAKSSALNATATRSGAQLEASVRASLAIVQTKASTTASPSSYAFLWRYDGFDRAEDGAAQAGEMALIEYDPVSKTVWLYQPLDESAMTSSQFDQAKQGNWGDLSSPDVVNYFKSGSFLAPRRPLLGPGLDTTSRAALVMSASFIDFDPAGGKPMLNYTMQIQPADATGTDAVRAVSGSISLRSPQTPSNTGGSQ
jgi:prepilin-type N-terminal cleavage/methylation domain-containing protein